MATSPGNSGNQRMRPTNDLYTVQLIVAAVILLVGIIALAMRTTALFGSLIPPAGG